MWLGWILASSAVLSLYDLSKKASVRGNAVFPTLLGSTLSGWMAVSAWLLWRGGIAATVNVTGSVAGLLLVKSVLVGASWTSTYMALRTLPITSAAPIRATGPLWTLLGAVAIFHELPSPLQFAGIALVLFGCWLFSRSNLNGGVPIWRNRAMALAFLGALLGSCSALYDKCLLQRLGIPTLTVLWWFLGGMCVIYGAATLLASRSADRPRFEWRWTIPAVGILLALSDACYFTAIGMPDAKISILSVIRRSSVVLTFIVGGAVFHEANLKRKAFALAAIIVGVVALCVK